jgi:hypothetical protein
VVVPPSPGGEGVSYDSSVRFCSLIS